MNKPKRQRLKILHKILIVFISLLILLPLATYYINHTFIPVKIKALIVQNLEEYTKQRVTIDSLRFDIAKGFTLENIRIFDASKKESRALFEAANASFRIIFIPSLKRQYLIIPNLIFNKPRLNIERAIDRTWNIGTLIAKKSNGGNKKAGFRLIIKNVKFADAELSYADYYRDKNFTVGAANLKGSVGLSLPKHLSVRCFGNIAETPFKIKGKYGLQDKDLSANLQIRDFPFAKYWNEYLSALLSPAEDTDTAQSAEAPQPNADTPLAKAFQAVPENSLNIYSGTCTADININMENFQQLRAEGSLNIINFKSDIRDIAFSGDYNFDGKASLDIKNSKDAIYDLKLKLINAKIAGLLNKTEAINNINGLIFLTEKKWSTKALSCSIYNSAVDIAGEVRSPHQDFIVDAEISCGISLKDIADAARTNFEDGIARIESKLIYKKDGSYRIDGNSQLTNLKLRQDGLVIGGNFLVKGKLSGIRGEAGLLDYSGTIDFSNALIEGAGLLPLISEVKGSASFGTNHIAIKKLVGVCADTEIGLSGNIEHSKQGPSLNLSLKADDISLSGLISTLPKDISAKFNDIEANGDASINVNFSGIVNRSETYAYSGNILLKKASVALKTWPYNITNIDSDIDFEKQKIVCKDLNFNIKDTRYSAYGTISGLVNPDISLSLSSERFNAAARIKREPDNVINILKLTGKYLNSTFSIKGMVKNIENPHANMLGDIYLDLRDVPDILPGYSQALKRLKPNGTVKFNFDMSGPLKEFKAWNLSIDGSSNAVYLDRLRFNDFYIEYRMKGYFIDIPIISAYPYGGIISANSRLNLKTEEQPYIINIDVKDIDLHSMVADTDLKDKKIKGTLSAKTVLNGYLGRKDSSKGSGWLQVSDGYLWEFPVLRGIMDVILMVPPEYVVLTDAFGNFSIQNSRIYTDDFKMLSKAASLLWIGSLGFDGTLDFNVTGRFAENVIKQTTEPGRIASAILHEAGNLIMEIRLGGTLSNPKYQIVPFPINRIIQEKVFDKLNRIFQKN